MIQYEGITMSRDVYKNMMNDERVLQLLETNGDVPLRVTPFYVPNTWDDILPEDPLVWNMSKNGWAAMSGV